MARPQPKGNSVTFSVVIPKSVFERLESEAEQRGMKWRVVAQQALALYAQNGKTA